MDSTTMEKFENFTWYASKQLEKSARKISANELFLVVIDLANKELARINMQNYKANKKKGKKVYINEKEK